MQDETAITIYTDQAIDTYVPPIPRPEVTIETVLGTWLDEKFRLSMSLRTKATYRNIIKAFRKMLQSDGLDLTMPVTDDRTAEDIEDMLIIRVQAFVSINFKDDSREISTTTRNKRLSVISSFYSFAVKRYRRMFPFRNPVSLLQRSKVEKYSKAKALNLSIVTEGLATIDDTKLQGARDKALLLVLLQTGRRVAEVAMLTWEHVEIDGKSGLVTLHFPRTKGDKTMSDELPAPISRALTSWLCMWYKSAFPHGLDKHAPLWVNLAEQHKRRVKQDDESYLAVSDYGQPLEYQGIAGIVKHYLGTTKVHRTRHTFTKLMLRAGASVQDVQRRLGHSNIATTQIYTEVIEQATNPHADAIAALLGMK